MIGGGRQPAEAPSGHATTHCRVCQGESLERFLDLGPMALANSFLRAGEESKPEPKFPLAVDLCHACGQVQLGFVVDPEILFRDYIYVSSTSETMRRHFADYADDIACRLADRPRSLVVEVASNDGCLLKAFRGREVRVLGVEPATNIAAIAMADGIPTTNAFFSEPLARDLRSAHGPAAAILANNVLAHVDDLDDFVGGMCTLLGDDGIIAVEVPHLATLIKGLEFDTIYHEHLSYFSLATLMRLFERFGLQVFDAKAVAVHGGSLRLYIGHGSRQVSPTVGAILAAERAMGLASPEVFQSFARAVAGVRDELRGLLTSIAASGQRIAGYGAPAKGNTLLQYCGLGTDRIDYIVDRSPLKQGLLTPGTHIPVFAPERLLETRPGAVLLLAWNFAEEVLRQQAVYRAGGGRFVVPLPRPTIM